MDTNKMTISKLGDGYIFYKTYYNWLIKDQIKEACQKGKDKGYKWLVILRSDAAGKAGGYHHDVYFHVGDFRIPTKRSLIQAITVFENGDNRVGFRVFVLNLRDDIDNIPYQADHVDIFKGVEKKRLAA